MAAEKQTLIVGEEVYVENYTGFIRAASRPDPVVADTIRRAAVREMLDDAARGGWPLFALLSGPR